MDTCKCVGSVGGPACSLRASISIVDGRAVLSLARAYSKCEVVGGSFAIWERAVAQEFFEGAMVQRIRNRNDSVATDDSRGRVNWTECWWLEVEEINVLLRVLKFSALLP